MDADWLWMVHRFAFRCCSSMTGLGSPLRLERMPGAVAQFQAPEQPELAAVPAVERLDHGWAGVVLEFRAVYCINSLWAKGFSFREAFGARCPPILA